MTTVELIDFSVFFRQKKQYVVALDHISLQIRGGEFLVVAGPSGCGKTTLLKAILGFCEHTDGMLLIDGEAADLIEIQKRNFAYVSQDYSLNPGLTVFDNIAFPLRMMRAPYEEVNRRVGEVAETLGLTILLSRKPDVLSGGQQQRVAIARAIVKNPRMMLFDEPFSNLDAKLRVEMRTLVKKLHEVLGTTTVFVTHDRQEAMMLADRLVIMGQARIEQIGTKNEIMEKPASEIVRGFLHG